MAPEAQSRLYVVAEAGRAPEQIGVVLASCDVAALLVSPAHDTALDARNARPLVELAQAKGIAALISGDAGLARTLRADGVHLPWDKDIVARYGEAREIVGGRFIVGADAGRSRDDAMSLGEAGADYIAFGIPAHVEDRDTARARRLDLIGWWSEIFEVPCVAFDVETAQEAAALVEAGADFVAVAMPTLQTDELSRWGEEMARALAVPEGAA
ncbi:MAG TPA: thiamine phosphate synthase [Hyphomicrobium sp.]